MVKKSIQQKVKQNYQLCEGKMVCPMIVKGALLFQLYKTNLKGFRNGNDV